MKYKCTNELHTLNFRDFTVTGVVINNGNLTISSDGGVARYDNSCNETLEERYISATEIQFLNYTIDKFFIEGAKYFDANDVLLKETPDIDVEKVAYESTLKSLKDGKIFFLNEKKSESSDNKYVVELAVDIEETNDTYWLIISTEKTVINFDRFMNRVMA